MKFLNGLHYLAVSAVLLCLITDDVAVSVEDCCELIAETHQSCSHTCAQMLSPGVASNKHVASDTRVLSSISTLCPRDLVEFWRCLNASLAADHWWGRPCCELSLTSQCRHACRRARSRDSIGSECSAGDELAVFVCLDRYEEGHRCCPAASSRGQCHVTCRRIFVQDTAPTQSQLTQVQRHCDQNIVKCLQNYTRRLSTRNATDSLPCCNKTDSLTCRDRCHVALSSLTQEEQIIEEVSKHCGVPNPSTPLWQCFLRSSTNSIRYHDNHGSNIDLTGIDGAKLQCCNKAITYRCRQLCIRTFSRDWTDAVLEFQQQCTYQVQEINLNMCLDDVEEQCQLGCNTLSYCKNFNHRPTELFRSCSPQSDRDAQTAVSLWERGTISLPMLVPFDIPVKDIRTCRPATWQAIACTVHIKPCLSNGRAGAICRSDCISLLSECLDVSRLQPSLNAELICAKISPIDNTAPCVSISTYLVANDYQLTHNDVTSPCHPNPCPASQICQVVRHSCSAVGHSACRGYICKPGCPMGEVVTQLVPHHSYVRVPAETPHSGAMAPSGARRVQCYRMCKCGKRNTLNQCSDVSCVQEQQCLLKTGMILDHGVHFNVSCNNCVCFSSESLCTSRHCLTSRSSTTDISKFTGLPCNCPAVYIPVCGINGQTFPSLCIATCHGFTSSQLDFDGSCVSVDPCSSNPCPMADRCVAKRQVCLGRQLKSTDCQQFECVKLIEACDRHSAFTGPVCDDRNEEFLSLCHLLQHRRTLAYHGHCRIGCQLSGPVCGLDFNSYPSECSAWVAGVPVDYSGHCHTVGQPRGSRLLSSLCANVTCSSRSTIAGCQPVTPPGACCPVCAGEIRALVSPLLISEAVNSGLVSSITIGEVLDVLRMQLSVTECDVFAYNSIESDVVILIMPVTAAPTALQVEACMKETQKLGALISTSSPVVMTFVAVSVFVSANVRTCISAGAGSSTLLQHSYCSMLMCLLTVVLIQRFHASRT